MGPVAPVRARPRKAENKEEGWLTCSQAPRACMHYNHQASRGLLLAAVCVEIGESLPQMVWDRDQTSSLAAWFARRDSSPGLRSSSLRIDE